MASRRSRSGTEVQCRLLPPSDDDDGGSYFVLIATIVKNELEMMVDEEATQGHELL